MPTETIQILPCLDVADLGWAFHILYPLKVYYVYLEVVLPHIKYLWFLSNNTDMEEPKKNIRQQTKIPRASPGNN